MSIAQHIDHTNLKATATPADIVKLCNEAIEYGFRAVCVHPRYTHLAKQCLVNSDIKIATVVGFPLGANHLVVKVYESRIAANEGANELDIVWDLGHFKDKKYLTVLKELQAIVDTVHPMGVLVKVIVETCYLNYDEIIKAWQIVRDSGAYCIKTSTGFSLTGAEYPTIKTWADLGDLKIKASGGIKRYGQARNFISMGADILGTSHGIHIVQEERNVVTTQGDKL